MPTLLEVARMNLQDPNITPVNFRVTPNVAGPKSQQLTHRAAGDRRDI
jgi:hypothetical protein